MNDAVLLNLFGKFTGDIIGGKIRILKNDAEFYGKMNVAELEVYGSAFSVSPLQGSHVGTLNLFTSREASEVASIRIDSDLSANILYLRNDVDIASSRPFKKIAGKVAGNGTLKINNASIQIVQSTEVAPDKTAYFDGIKIAALNNDLTFNGDREAKYDFTNNAISAAGKIEFNTPTTFHGASFLTAQNITAKDVAGKASVWAQGLLNHAKMTDGFKADTAGFAAGVETNLTDSFKLGAGYAYASTDPKPTRTRTRDSCTANTRPTRFMSTRC